MLADDVHMCHRHSQSTAPDLSTCLSKLEDVATPGRPLCREITCYSYIITLQLVSGEAEVLIAGQTNTAVSCSSCHEHMGLMALINGEEKTGFVPSSAAQVQLVPSTK